MPPNKWAKPSCLSQSLYTVRNCINHRLFFLFFFTSFSCEGLLHKLNSIYHSKLNIFVHSTKKLIWKFLCLNYVKQSKRGKSFRPQDKQPRKKCTLNHIK